MTQCRLKQQVIGADGVAALQWASANTGALVEPLPIDRPLSPQSVLAAPSDGSPPNESEHSHPSGLPDPTSWTHFTRSRLPFTPLSGGRDLEMLCLCGGNWFWGFSEGLPSNVALSNDPLGEDTNCKPRTHSLGTVRTDAPQALNHAPEYKYLPPQQPAVSFCVRVCVPAAS